jgi:hypothetical protein
MAVVTWRRVLEGSELSGKVGESLRIVERWEVRVDSPLTTKLAIVGAVPVGWNSPHWEFPDCKAQEFSLSPNSRTGLVWTLTATYYLPLPNKNICADGLPCDFWEASGGSTSIPVFMDKDNEMICNSAGEPMEGLEREREEESWVLTKYYIDDSWKLDRDGYAGKVNSAEWANGDAKTWKCYFKSAKQKDIQDIDLNRPANASAEGGAADDGDVFTRTIVETVWEFKKEPKTWTLKPWDVGFMQLVSGKRETILGDDKKPVKQPVALNADGTKRTPGQKPSVIRNGAGAEVYDTADFAGKFGTPKIVAVGGG